MDSDIQMPRDSAFERHRWRVYSSLDEPLREFGPGYNISYNLQISDEEAEIESIDGNLRLVFDESKLRYEDQREGENFKGMSLDPESELDLEKFRRLDYSRTDEELWRKANEMYNRPYSREFSIPLFACLTAVNLAASLALDYYSMGPTDVLDQAGNETYEMAEDIYSKLEF